MDNYYLSTKEDHIIPHTGCINIPLTIVFLRRIELTILKSFTAYCHVTILFQANLVSILVDAPTAVFCRVIRKIQNSYTSSNYFLTHWNGRDDTLRSMT